MSVVLYSRITFWMVSLLVIYLTARSLNHYHHHDNIIGVPDDDHNDNHHHSKITTTTFKKQQQQQQHQLRLLEFDKGVPTIATKTTTTSETKTTTTTNTTTSSSSSSLFCNDKFFWTIVVSGNSAYLQDLLTWWYHCERVGLCCKPQHHSQYHPYQSSSYCCSQVIFYAEDETIYNVLQSSKVFIVKKSWETGTNHININITGQQRFTYDQSKPFNQMMSRRPSMIYNELQELMLLQQQQEEKQQQSIEKEEKEHEEYTTKSSSSTIQHYLIFSDLDVYLLQDPRPYFTHDNHDNDNTSTSTASASSSSTTSTGMVDFWGQDAQNSKTGPFNGGFLVFRPTPTTLRIIQEWKDILEQRVEKPSPNQMSFNRIVKRYSSASSANSASTTAITNDNTATTSTTTVKAKLLPIPQFQVGKVLTEYTKQERKKQRRQKKKTKQGNHDNGDNENNDTMTTDETTTTMKIVLPPLDPNVVVFHNNWCEKGCSKVDRAKELGLWHPVDLETIMG